MKWLRELAPGTREDPRLVGAKAHGLVELRRLGLPVPPGFVVTTEACRAFLRDGRLPDGLSDELAAATRALEDTTGRRFGGSPPLTVSVRSGASVSMPGMMDTILNLGLTAEATDALAAETGDSRFALESRARFLAGFASATRHGRELPAKAADQLEAAVEAVFASWETPRARTYRELHGIDHDLGTAVVVQEMVYGNRDDRSGTGVAFSRDPGTGEPDPFGDVLFAHQGEDVVAGTAQVLPLTGLTTREPRVWAALTDALIRLEDHYRDAVYVEFTFEAGVLWLLQVRPGRFTGAAAVRVAVDLADEGRISRADAVRRVSPRQVERARTPRLAPNPDTTLLGRGTGACPGVATGRIATTTEAARRLAADGPVILVRPETSPNDMNGLAVAAGILTARGGPASHAAVVARSLGKPAVVGMGTLVIDEANASVTVGGRSLAEGMLVTIDGTSGEVALGRVPTVMSGNGDHLERLLAWAGEGRGPGETRGT
ncbi:pyruvate, phosphate dikinase [Amycolatopsis regifaucium]|uniref:Pyruvate, phosphate dikinase n=1 Tax=Amycolatopsis regifaucium TaxID=546365 RepID=A0A154ML03_9PSEU|nr:pyruvate, phosphate dikinase [Amycolatopsis regifaucium]KZB84683.1 pyruvate, phosphate dikinase [Amycolatopsis regifaucium]OKA11149.1 pyruvate, phosphate dikinase [Amycolatopsis regifaucium]SFI30143.1 pyruvate, orthophosphate dikinase [Amycolatopsis regifaucium]